MEHPSHDPIEPPPGPLKRLAVYATVALTVLLAIGLVAVTGIRWMLQQTPSSILVIHSDATMVGATVLVARETERPRPAVTITSDADGQTPLFLENGTYSVRVEKDAKVIFRTDRPLYVAAGRRYDIDLRPTTAPVNKP